MTEEKKRSGFDRLLAAWAADREAVAAQRRLIVDAAAQAQSYQNFGVLMYRAMQAAGSYLLVPTDLDQIMTASTFGISAPNCYVYRVDVTGSAQAAQGIVRRELARIMGISLQELLKRCEILIVGNNVILKFKN